VVEIWHLIGLRELIFEFDIPRLFEFGLCNGIQYYTHHDLDSAPSVADRILQRSSPLFHRLKAAWYGVA
jgi:hypothetical protein